LKIVHIITGLDTGGAELMLARMLAHSGRGATETAVISLTDIGPAGRSIEDAGIPVHALNMLRGVPDPRALVKLTRLLRSLRPDVVQTWLYHADLMGGLAAKLAGGIPVAWGLHLGNLAPELNKRSTLLTARACARLSGILPKSIVCCAESTRASHAEIGYRTDRMVVIPNGFDLDQFRPDAAARDRVRAELGLTTDTELIGLVARFDPQKDHKSFVRAAGLLAQFRPDARFLFCGAGASWDNHLLASWIEAASLRNRVHLLGRRDDVAAIQAALDLACSSSRGEAFPLAVGEAMASGIPCVATDVGDSALIVGNTGRIVPAGDPAAMAAAMTELLTLDPAGRHQLGARARRRIAERFSLERTLAAYDALYADLAQRTTRATALEGLR
jgi:glycosyltransferase involved in cell wall biosynthesis